MIKKLNFNNLDSIINVFIDFKIHRYYVPYNYKKTRNKVSLLSLREIT